MTTDPVDRSTSIDEIVERLRSDRGVRQSVAGGILHIDRPAPYLCVVRRPADDSSGLDGLVYGQGSYLIGSDDEGSADEIRTLLHEVVGVLDDRFGSVLVLELWSAPEEGARFAIHAPDTEHDSTSVVCLREAIEEMELPGTDIGVDVVADAAPAPPHAAALLTAREVRKAGCVLLGLEIPPLHIDPQTQRHLPVVYRDLQGVLSAALHRAFFGFATVQTTFEVKDFRALGRRSILDATREVDDELVSLAEDIEFLLAITPVDSDRAWAEFEASGFTREPIFHYRPLHIDPDVQKRRLFDIELEAVEDPTLMALFRAKRHELDRMLTMLEDRGTPAFLAGSVALYGRPEDELCALANELLEHAVPGADTVRGEWVDASTLADRVRQELWHYRRVHRELTSRVEIRDDVPGILTDAGDVYIGSALSVAASRVEALIQHEVGVHVVTYANGSLQPLRLFRVGLPGYEETQEGLATLAEYAVGGLGRGRLATLAGRVLAVRTLLGDGSFVDTFDVLRERGFAASGAFGIAMRVHRSGGLTKDAIYLRGLVALLDHVSTGGHLEPLLVGKLPLTDVDVAETLMLRGVLQSPQLRPRWLDDADAKGRIGGIRTGMTMTELAREVSP